MEDESTKKKDNPGKKPKWSLGPIIIILIGLLWLLNNLGVIWAGDVWVPASIIVVGIYLLLKRKDEKT